MVHRLLSIPLSQEDYKNEVAIIKHIAISNGYKTSLITDLIKKYKKSHTKPQPKINSKYVAIDYGHMLHHTLKKKF
jgi:hypothetical protein